MSNLGDSNTPVEGESFGLPAGAELTEDANGNLAIADSSGSIVLVRDETAEQWDLNNDSLTGINAIDAGSANVGQIDIATTTIIVSSDGWQSVSGSDPDDRLSNALDAASTGDKIHLENATYTTNQTISDRVLVTGTGHTELDADWTIDNRAHLTHFRVSVDNPEITIASDNAIISNLMRFGVANITINENNALLYAINNADVTFEDGTSGGLVDTSIDTSVTDNGNNTVGDIT